MHISQRKALITGESDQEETLFRRRAHGADRAPRQRFANNGLWKSVFQDGAAWLQTAIYM